MSIMRLQNGAVALQIYALAVVSGKHPVPAGLFQAAPHGVGLVARAGRRRARSRRIRLIGR
jgi:hypothetical protein